MSSVDRVRYRVGQLRRTLKPRVAGDERQIARAALGERLYPLFASMQAADQRHCLDVYARLVSGGCGDADVLQAALLHDAGKGSIAGARFGVHHRVAYTLLERFPAAISWLARGNRGIRSLQAHGPKTIALAREYGANPDVVLLLQDVEGGRPQSERGRFLKAADDRS